MKLVSNARKAWMLGRDLKESCLIDLFPLCPHACLKDLRTETLARIGLGWEERKWFKPAACTQLNWSWQRTVVAPPVILDCRASLEKIWKASKLGRIACFQWWAVIQRMVHKVISWLFRQHCEIKALFSPHCQSHIVFLLATTVLSLCWCFNIQIRKKWQYLRKWFLKIQVITLFWPVGIRGDTKKCKLKPETLTVDLRKTFLL